MNNCDDVFKKSPPLLWEQAAKGENTNDEKKFYFTFIRFIL